MTAERRETLGRVECAVVANESNSLGAAISICKSQCTALYSDQSNIPFLAQNSVRQSPTRQTCRQALAGPPKGREGQQSTSCECRVVVTRTTRHHGSYASHEKHAWLSMCLQPSRCDWHKRVPATSPLPSCFKRHTLCARPLGFRGLIDRNAQASCCGAPTVAQEHMFTASSIWEYRADPFGLPRGVFSRSFAAEWHGSKPELYVQQDACLVAGIVRGPA
jgi:hypothetical protein